MNTFIAEKVKSTVLLAIQATDTGAEKYGLPAACSAVNIRAIAKMGDSDDLTLSLKYADDASGTNAAAFPVNVPIFVNGARESSDEKTYAITAATGDFIVDFCLDVAAIPEGKFVGLSYANSDSDNLLTTLMIEDSIDKPAV